MKKLTKTKIPRKVLVLSFLIVGLVVIGTNMGNHASAKSCEQAFIDYMNANTEYDSARISYFYGEPTSCNDVCYGLTGTAFTNCMTNCAQERADRLAFATIALLDNAIETCTPPSPNECAQARAMADDCVNQYNNALSDPNYDPNSIEETDAIFTQYGACLTASKVDSCQ